MCTNSNGTYSNSSCNSGLSADNVNQHLENMNSIALNYCNPNYAKGGICNEETAWAMADADYQRIIGKTLSECEYDPNNSSKEKCEEGNDLLVVGGYYWLATHRANNNIYAWVSDFEMVYYGMSRNLCGVRPVLYLDSNTIITNGEGTYTSPYQLETKETN